MKHYIKGNYRKSIFKTDQGYVIGLFKVRDTNSENLKEFVNKTITFTGYFHELNEDDLYVFYGEDIFHPRYGLQFQVTEYERLTPKDKDGLIEFLSSDLFKGVGEALATNIVNELGENAIEKILENEEVLYDIPKLTIKKAHKIYETLNKYESSHQVIIYLTELGFNMKDSLNIYNTYKEQTINNIEYNIYKLIDDINGISFVKVDEVAKKFNIKEDDERRIKAAIIYVMNKLVYEKSDTYLEYNEIYNGVYGYLRLNLDNDLFNRLLSELEQEFKIVIEDDRYYLKEMYEAEENIANKIKIITNLNETKYKNLDEKINYIEEINNLKYSENQKKAIKSALIDNLLIITGGPGTGKTTIVKAICQLYMELNDLDFDNAVNNIALLAPTGRASKRLSESTNLPAYTIHRFLKWNQEKNEFAVNEYNKNVHKLIIIDEVSMLDTLLLDSLFKGLNDNIKVILVGDHNQLPSVGPGQILKDLIESDVIPIVYLDLLYRQDENSYITTLAQEIKNDSLSETFLETRSDYTFLRCNSLFLKQNLINLCEQIISKGYDYKRVQLMAPMYKGENGIDVLNSELQNVFNPAAPTKKEIKYGDVIFRENDKILQLVNMPEENIYNGDIGVIKYILTENTKSKRTEIYIDFDGNVVRFLPKDLIKIKHGFIISIHKSQGSEFEMVVMPICKSYKRMLYRKLIYTGITRAKRKLILIGEDDAFIYSVKNNSEMSRKTSLKEKLMNKILN